MLIFAYLHQITEIFSSAIFRCKVQAAIMLFVINRWLQVNSFYQYKQTFVKFSFIFKLFHKKYANMLATTGFVWFVWLCIPEEHYSLGENHVYFHSSSISRCYFMFTEIFWSLITSPADYFIKISYFSNTDHRRKQK